MKRLLSTNSRPMNGTVPERARNGFSDLAAVRKATAVTSLAVRLQKPLHAEVTGDRAYVVHLANLSYTMKGNRRRNPARLRSHCKRALPVGELPGLPGSAH